MLLTFRRPSHIVALALIATVTSVTAAVLVAGDIQTATAERRVVRVRAERFSFTPSEITMTVGETIELRVKSDDTTHGFHIKGTDTDIAVPKRGKGETTVVFTGTQAGRNEFECNRMCGAGHDFMRGVIVVKAPVTTGGAQ